MSSDARDLALHRAEHAAELLDGALEFLRLEALQPTLRGLLRGLDLRRDADVAGIELAAAADRATDRHHRERSEPHAVRSEAEHLRNIERALHAAVAPELDDIAQPRRHERAVRLRDADLHRKTGAAERVLARGAGAAVVTGERDDVGARLRDADRDDADVGYDRDLDRNARARIHGLELVNDLREVLDRVDVVI